MPDDIAMATLRAAYESGTTFFDTADVYGMGRSETFIGQFLQELGPARADIFVATKLANSWSRKFSAVNVAPAVTNSECERLVLIPTVATPADAADWTPERESSNAIEASGMAPTRRMASR